MASLRCQFVSKVINRILLECCNGGISPQTGTRCTASAWMLAVGIRALQAAYWLYAGHHRALVH